MSLTRRDTLRLIGATSVTALLPLATEAQPGKKLTILVGFPAGGSVDTVTRAVGAGLTAAGSTAIVENKTGAGGRLAADALLAAPADGGTVMMTPGGTLTIYPHIYKKLRYDSLKDFAPLATACEFQFAVAVGPDVPAKTLKEFIDWAKAHPDKASFGSPGAGTGMHFLGVMLGRAAKVDLLHVPYRGGAPAMTDVMGGNIPAVFTTLPQLVQPHKAGKVRILAQSGEARLKNLPDVPTFAESGYPDLTMSEMFLFVGRAQTPPALQKELAAALRQAAASKPVEAALESAGYSPLALAPEAIAERLRKEHAQWAKVVKETGYKAEE